jgi:hypothetical protein
VFSAYNNAGLAFDRTYAQYYPLIYELFESRRRDLKLTIDCVRPCTERAEAVRRASCGQDTQSYRRVEQETGWPQGRSRIRIADNAVILLPKSFGESGPLLSPRANRSYSGWKKYTLCVFGSTAIVFDNRPNAHLSGFNLENGAVFLGREQIEKAIWALADVPDALL